MVIGSGPAGPRHVGLMVTLLLLLAATAAAGVVSLRGDRVGRCQ